MCISDATKSAELCNVRNVAHVFLGRGGGNRVGRGKVVEVSGIVEGFEPVRLREICIGKHHMSSVEEHLVKVLGDSVVLGGVQSCDFMLNPTLVKVVFDMASYVLASPVRAEYLDLLASFQFCL